MEGFEPQFFDHSTICVATNGQLVKTKKLQKVKLNGDLEIFEARFSS